ncbi:MAG: serine protease [Syntrophales bacterium]
MNKCYLLIVVGVLGYSSLAYTLNSEENLKQSELAIVKIHVTGTSATNKDVVKDGTGFFFDDKGYILTALHVIGESRDYENKPDGNIDRKIIVSFLTPEYEVKTCDEEAEEVYIDSPHDLALLHIICKPSTM